MDYKVPFYANTPDATHCLQASYKSILKYFMPDRDFSWEELDKATAKVEGLWTWSMAGLIWMKGLGFEVRNIEVFDYNRFMKEGGDYLKEKYGPDAAQRQIDNSDIEQEKIITKDFLKEIITEDRQPTLEDIKQLLAEGFLLGANVNSRTLNDKPGYAGHFVVIKGIQGDELIFHDPGPPAFESRKMPFKKFDKAWAYPTAEERNIMAFKKDKA